MSLASERIGDNEQFVLDMLDMPEHSAAYMRARQLADGDAARGYEGWELYRMLRATLADKFPADFDWIATDYGAVIGMIRSRMLTQICSSISGADGSSGGGGFWRPGDPVPEYDPASGWTPEEHENFYDVPPAVFCDEGGARFVEGDLLHYSLIDHPLGSEKGSIFGPAEVVEIDHEAHRFFVRWLKTGKVDRYFAPEGACWTVMGDEAAAVRARLAAARKDCPSCEGDWPLFCEHADANVDADAPLTTQ